MTPKPRALVLLLMVGLAGCAPGATDEGPSLLAVHEAGKRAHVETDVAALLENAADEFIAVSNGKIYRQTRAEVEAFFKGYLDGAVYEEYADAEPPIVRVSADGSMGWIISRLRASRSQPDSEGVPRHQEFVYAGIMVFEKRDGTWLRVANVSTFE